MLSKSADYVSFARSNLPTNQQIQRIWDDASQYDSSLCSHSKMTSKLLEKRIVPEHFSRSQLFARMLSGSPSLFSDFPLHLRTSSKELSGDVVLNEIKGGFPRAKRARVRVGPLVRYVPIPEVAGKWKRAHSIFGVTDLHYIGTRFDTRLDTSSLNDFNLLPRGTDGFQSQDSLVISSAGGFTDSHSDDHSGSNHCFTGAKVWLMWDTIEGLRHGLEDAERCKIRGRAAFDTRIFLSLSSSRWLLIASGQTIFIPGHLTHKVITLEKYLGLGSFHAGLPSFIDTLLHWKNLSPLWSRPRKRDDSHCCVSFITDRAIRKVRALERATKAERFRWGVPYLQTRLRQLRSEHHSVIGESPSKEDGNLVRFVRAAQRLK
jgi:hypothetical protein